jgi:UDP-N-acetylmuramate dehydrogenase
MRVGGPLPRLVTASKSAEIHDFVSTIGAEGPLIIGGGSNIIVSDEGYPGPVLRMSGGSLAIERPASGPYRFIVDAGVEWDELVRQSIREGCTGLELMSGIPGRVGAAPIQNIAAYGQQVSDVIAWVDTVSWEGAHLRLRAEECDFGFRTSRFKGDLLGVGVVTSVCFEVPRALDARPEPSTYIDIERYFSEGGDPADIVQRREAVLAARRRKSMLLDRDDPLSRSVGSFFVNPRVPNDLADAMAEEFGTAGLRVDYLDPRHRHGDGTRRVPAAHLLRHAGFNPGDSWGPVKLSDKHLLAVVANEGATATDVWMLGCYLRSRVERATGVVLDYEARFAGQFPEFDEMSFHRTYAYTPGDSPEPNWLKTYRGRAD